MKRYVPNFYEFVGEGRNTDAIADAETRNIEKTKLRREGYDINGLADSHNREEEDYLFDERNVVAVRDLWANDKNTGVLYFTIPLTNEWKVEAESGNLITMDYLYNELSKTRIKTKWKTYDRVLSRHFLNIPIVNIRF